MAPALKAVEFNGIIAYLGTKQQFHQQFLAKKMLLSCSCLLGQHTVQQHYSHAIIFGVLRDEYKD